MAGFDGWNLAILAVAAYVAVMALVRLMGRRRDALVDDLVEQANAELERQRALRRKAQQRQIRRRLRARKDGDAT